MGVDTKGKIKGFVHHEDIVDFIRKNIDENVKHDIKKRIRMKVSDITWPHTLCSDDEHEIAYDGFIYFHYEGNERCLFYHHSNVNHLESLTRYIEMGLEDMVKSETTYLSLGCYGNSVEIIHRIISEFGGGWLDENDCDNISYYWINGNKEYKPPRCVTMKEVYEKFGEIVIIRE